MPNTKQKKIRRLDDVLQFYGNHKTGDKAKVMGYDGQSGYYKANAEAIIKPEVKKGEKKGGGY